jgi:hypothetical protein
MLPTFRFGAAYIISCRQTTLQLNFTLAEIRQKIFVEDYNFEVSLLSNCLVLEKYGLMRYDIVWLL